jgi:hypothetical protein
MQQKILLADLKQDLAKTRELIARTEDTQQFLKNAAHDLEMLISQWDTAHPHPLLDHKPVKVKCILSNAERSN